MIKGIYTSATAMREGILRQEINASNLANAGTTGFKRDRLFIQELTAAQTGSATTDPLSKDIGKWTEFSAGAYMPTSAPLDFSLQGKGFFVVSDGQSEFYTRDGHFERNSEGQLVDVQGRLVQGEGGNITLPAGLVSASSDGSLSVDGVNVDRLRVVNFDNPQTLQKAAGSAFAKSAQTAADVPVENPVVRQGFLESSNVDAVKEMVEMIATARNYEINAKLLTAQDDTLRQTVGELGRV
jgi:flagellar basal-body rod protein FlgF